MSSPTAQLASEHKDADPNNEASHPSTQMQPKDSSPHNAGTNEITPPAKARDPLSAFVLSVQSPPDGNCFDMLGSDGVWRVLQYLPGPPDEPTGIQVYDAKPMSPELIKKYLDTRLWRQELEDRFRGVDGRTVPQEYVPLLLVCVF